MRTIVGSAILLASMGVMPAAACPWHGAGAHPAGMTADGGVFAGTPDFYAAYASATLLSQSEPPKDQREANLNATRDMVLQRFNLNRARMGGESDTADAAGEARPALAAVDLSDKNESERDGAE